MSTQPDDDDQTKPHTFGGALADDTKPAKADDPAKSAKPAKVEPAKVESEEKADLAEQRAVALTKTEDPPAWSESAAQRDHRETVPAEPATRGYPPVATSPGYGAVGPSAAGGPAYSGPGGYGGPGGYLPSAPPPPQHTPSHAPPQVQPVSRQSSAARRARLKVSHLGPLSVLRVSLTFSLCMFIVLLVAVAALWGVLDSSGVFKSIVDAATTLTNDKNQSGIAPWLTFGRVMLITVVLGAANVIAFTLLSTIGALLYNLCSDFVGGVEVTLIER